MTHEQKLTVYTIKLKPKKKNVTNTNKWLFRNIVNKADTNPIDDQILFLDIFKKFIYLLDTEEMYKDSSNQKCMTINQADVDRIDVNANIIPHADKFIIEGKIEGGSFGRKRNKISTANKTDKSEVKEKDAITDYFYFMIYTPLYSDKSIMFIHSYSDNNIDNIVKKFLRSFLSHTDVFGEPAIKRFIPKEIIADFKSEATVSSLTFSTDIPSESLLDKTYKTKAQNFNVTIKITPIGNEFTIDEFEKTLEPIQKASFSNFTIGLFNKKRGSLRDTSTNKTSPFELDTFNIKPSITLSKYISIKNDESDFDEIKKYCFTLLENIKPEIYTNHAVQNR